MIEEGDGWKFQSVVGEYPAFKDQVVEHIETGAHAIRRVFDPKFSADKKAVETVVAQIHDAADIVHRGLPRVFRTEEIAGHFCVYIEEVRGSDIIRFVSRRDFVKPEAWADIALDLCKLFQEFEAHSIAFDQIAMEDIIISNNTYRIRSRRPVGPIKSTDLQAAPRLQDLEKTKLTGVYVAKNNYPAGQGFRKLKNILYFLASGQVTKTMETVLEEAGPGAESPSKALKIDSRIARVLMRLHDQSESRCLKTIEELKNAVAAMSDDRSAPSSAPAIATQSDSFQVEETPAVHEPPKVEAAPESKTPDLPATPKAKPVATSASQSSAATAMISSSGPTEEDVEEDRSYLYPDRQKPATPEKKGSLPSSSSGKLGSTASAIIEASGGKSSFNLIVVAFIVLGVVVLGGVGVMFLNANKSKNNAPPVAAFSVSSETVGPRDWIELDASGTTDPNEGDTLRYSWSVPDMETANFRFDPTQSGTDAQKVRVQFFKSGVHTIQLKVFDGLANSPLVSTKVTITSDVE